MSPGSPVCIVMARAPHVGKVKTRLGKSLGAVEALRIYRRLVEHQLARIPSAWRVVIQYTPADADREMRDWLGSGLTYRSQRGGDLGERLIDAIRTVFEGGRGPSLVIGGDCPGLSRQVLEQATRLLGRSDVVIGPAVDGGYTLLGLNRSTPDLFRGIPWGTRSVFKKTLARIAGAGLSVSKLPLLEDVDDRGSWERNRHFLKD